MRRLPDSGVGSDDGFDSQADSQLRERRRTVTDVSGRLKRRFDLGWTSADGSGCEKPGLQNRVRSSANVRSSLSTAVHRR